MIETIHCYAIFGPNQIEHPGMYVVRRFTALTSPDSDEIDVSPDPELFSVTPTLTTARWSIPDAYTVAFRREPNDDPALIETYF